MPEEWFDITTINFDKVILHGRISDGIDENRFHRVREVEQVLTPDQKDLVADLQSRHHDELQKLLRTFVESV